MVAVFKGQSLSSQGYCTLYSKVHGANMGPIWGRQDPAGPHVAPMNFAIWASSLEIAQLQEEGKIILLKEEIVFSELSFHIILLAQLL